MNQRKTPQKFNPAWPSAKADSREARRLRKQAYDHRKREQVDRINTRLAPIGLTLDQVIDGLDKGTIVVYIV